MFQEVGAGGSVVGVVALDALTEAFDEFGQLLAVGRVVVDSLGQDPDDVVRQVAAVGVGGKRAIDLFGHVEEPVAAGEFGVLLSQGIHPPFNLEVEQFDQGNQTVQRASDIGGWTDAGLVQELVGHARPQVDCLGAQLDLTLVRGAIRVLFPAHHDGLDVQARIAQTVFIPDLFTVVLHLDDLEVVLDHLEGRIEEPDAGHDDAYTGFVGDLFPRVGVVLARRMCLGVEAGELFGSGDHLAIDPHTGSVVLKVRPGCLGRPLDAWPLLPIAMESLFSGQGHEEAAASVRGTMVLGLMSVLAGTRCRCGPGRIEPGWPERSQVPGSFLSGRARAVPQACWEAWGGGPLQHRCWYW